MKDKLVKLAKAFHPAQLSSLAAYLLRDEAISGKLIIGAVTLALIAVNTPLVSAYDALWATELNIGIGSWALSMDLRHWVSNGLMAFFFLVVGLELRRELTRGELRGIGTAVLPFAAALGGMLLPAIIYIAFNRGYESLGGWAIPTATDIALAIGLLAILGKRIPSSIRIFLLTLAIVDDIAAVILIAVFYSSGINLAMLCLAAAIVLVLVAIQKSRLLTLPLFIVLGLGLWLCVHASGVHASIAGAILGLLAPLYVLKRGVPSISERLEKAIIPFSTLVVVPIFAFANTGIALSFSGMTGETAERIAIGIIVGLVVGKFVGIVGASWLMIKLKIAQMPARASWAHIVGVGLLAGIGFTVSIFVTELAFDNDSYVMTAKLSIFIASILSAAVGLFVLRAFTHKAR